MNNVFLGKPNKKIIDFIWNKILHFTAEEDNSSVAMVNSNNVWEENVKLEISVNKGEWTEWNGYVVNLNKDDVVYIRAIDVNERISTSWSNYYKFVMTGKIAGGGNIQYLLSKKGNVLDMTGKSYCYYKMFSYCTSLTQAPALPATALASYCYASMFSGCTALTQAPQLPATALASYCYASMFSGCTALTQAPQLPATTLTNCYHCYASMFSGCTALTQAPELQATTLAAYCYYQMFYGCTFLTQAPELPATTLDSYCYYQMFYGCTALTQAPQLLATTLASYCYTSMFDGCTELKISENGTEGTVVLDLQSGTAEPKYWNDMMFSLTGGSFKGSPSVGKTYRCY